MSERIPSTKRKSGVLNSPFSEYNLLILLLFLLKSTFVTFEKEDIHHMSAAKNDQVGFQVYGRYYVYGITNNIEQGNLVQRFVSVKSLSFDRSLDPFRI